MGWFNSVFNFFKNGLRNVGGTIKRIASGISSGVRYFSFLPGIAQVANSIATVSDAVGSAVDIGLKVGNLGEKIQNSFGLDTGQSQPQTQPESQSQSNVITQVSPYNEMVRRVPLGSGMVQRVPQRVR